MPLFKITLLVALIGVIVIASKKVIEKPKLDHFVPSEFGVFYPLMSIDLLLKLDRFRALWGAPVEVSPAVGGIGRHGGPDDESQHNIDRFGEVRAIDVFPRVGRGYIATEAERRRALSVARQAGFTGIGLYTDTSPGNMVHLDVRDDRVASNPALWSRVDGRYLSINQVV